jgi:hypothetical protein
MAGCDTKPIGGDHHASRKRVLTWMGVSAAGGAILTFLNIAGELGAASLGGGPALIAVAAILVGAAAMAVLGFFVGFMVEWFFNRLKAHDDPSKITVQGMIVCAGKNTGLPPINDNDWTFNVDAEFVVTDPIPGPSRDAVRTRAAPGSGLAQAFPTVDPEHGDIPVFHCRERATDRVRSRLGLLRPRGRRRDRHRPASDGPGSVALS